MNEDNCIDQQQQRKTADKGFRKSVKERKLFSRQYKNHSSKESSENIHSFKKTAPVTSQHFWNIATPSHFPLHKRQTSDVTNVVNKEKDNEIMRSS